MVQLGQRQLVAVQLATVEDPGGIGILGNKIVVTSDTDHCVYTLPVGGLQDDGKLTVLMKGATDPGMKEVDGPTTSSRTVGPLALAVEEKSVFMVSSEKNSLRLYSETEEVAHFIDNGREYCELVGLLHPTLEKDEKERKRVREIQWLEVKRRMMILNADKRKWFEELKRWHCLHDRYAALNGGHGCSDQRVHEHWEMNEASLQVVYNRLALIGEQGICAALLHWIFTTLPVENQFGNIQIASSTRPGADS